MRLYLNIIFLLVAIVSVLLVAQASAEIFMLDNTQIPIPGDPSIILLGVGFIGLTVIKRK